MRRALAALVIGACVLASLLPSATAQAVQAPVLRVALTSQIGELNPLLASTDAAQQILRYQYETLVSLDQDNRVGEGVAHDWSTSDGKRWTFSLRDDRVFSDGTSLTSADVLYSFAALMKTSDDGITAHPEVDNVADVSAPDEYTVVIDMSRPQAYPPGASVFIVPQHIWSAHSNPTAIAVPSDDGTATVGSGPFMLTSATSTSAVMRANPLFWRGTPSAAGISWQVYDDQLAAMKALVTGDIDVVSDLSTNDARTLEQIASVNVSAGVGESALILGINSGRTNIAGTIIGDGNAALRDPAVRRAVAIAIDTDEVVDQAFAGLASPGVTLMPPAYAHYAGLASSTPARAQGIDAASALLNQAGYEPNDDGQLIGLDGIPLTLRLEFVAADSSHQRAAVLIRQTLAQLGIEVMLIPSDASLISANAYSGSHDLYLATHDAGPYPSVLLAANTCAARAPVATSTPTAPQDDDSSRDQPDGDDDKDGDDGDAADNPTLSAAVSSGWCSAEFDELYAAQALESGPDRRVEFVKEAFSLLYDHDSLVVLAYPDALSAFWNKEFVALGLTPASGGAAGSSLSYWTYYLAVPAKDDVNGIGSASAPQSTWWRTGAIAAGIVAGVGLGIWANRRRHRSEQTSSPRHINWRGHDK